MDDYIKITFETHADTESAKYIDLFQQLYDTASDNLKHEDMAAFCHFIRCRAMQYVRTMEACADV